MRHLKFVFVIAAALEKRLGTHVTILQSDRFTEWRVGEVGFAVGPEPSTYPPKQLLETLVAYFNKHIPKKPHGHSNKRD
jgi:hypothetical protein